jgi:hypothetical protein
MHELRKRIFFNWYRPAPCFFVPQPLEALFAREYPDHSHIKMSVFITNDYKRACFGKVSADITTYRP